MRNTCLLSTDAKNYLCCFYQLLDEMVQGMTTASLNQSISHNFIAQLIPHHQAAIRMSENILRFTDSKPIRRAAQSVIGEHSQTITQMEAALPSCNQLTNPHTDLRLYQRRMDLIYRDLYSRLGASPEHNRLDSLFLQQIVPLQRGAVRMAENALKYDISTQLVPILRTIVAQRRRCAGQMAALLNRTQCQRR